MNIAQPMNPFNQNPQKSSPKNPFSEIFKQPYQVLGEIISNDLIQAKGANVPTEHLIQKIVEMVNPSIVKSSKTSNDDLVATSTSSVGGNFKQQPPQPPIPKPPQPPTPAKNEESDSPLVASNQSVVDEVSKGTPQSTSITEQSQQISSPMQSRLITPQGLLGRLFQQSGYDRNTGEVRTGGLFNLGPTVNTIAKGQEIVGEQPMQQGDVQKLAFATSMKKREYETERADKLIDRFVNPQPLSGESAKQLEFANEVYDASSQLLDFFNKDSELLRQITLPGGMWNKSAQRVITISNRLKAALVPARAGASLTKEEKKLIDDITSPAGLKARLKDPEDLKFRLSSLQSDMKRLSGTLNPDRENQILVKGLLAKGFTKDEVYDYLKRNGRAA